MPYVAGWADGDASLMREYMRWPYGKCARVLVPSDVTVIWVVPATWSS